VQRQQIPHSRGLAAFAAALAAAGCGGAGVSFDDDVQPIFDRKCTACHPTSYPYLDLRRERSYQDLVRVSARTRPAFQRVLPGRPELSYLLSHPADPSLTGLLTDQEIELIARWIDEGAKDN
jgi:hypothetical protein